MNVKLLPIFTALLSLTLFCISCNKDDDKPVSMGYITINNVKKEIKMATHYMSDQLQAGAFRFSTASSKAAFDPNKDFDIYIELPFNCINEPHGAEFPNEIRCLEIRGNGAKATASSLSSANITLGAGTIEISRGSYGKGHARIKLSVAYETGEPGQTASMIIDATFDGTMAQAAAFSAV